ncbi:MAG: hypothetical protein AAFP84_04630 [Actinomycetota bacterium]
MRIDSTPEETIEEHGDRRPDQPGQPVDASSERGGSTRRGLERRRMLGLAGAGAAAGTAALLATAGSTASAADGDNAVIGQNNEGESATEFTNTTTPADPGGDANALKGTIGEAENGSDAIVGSTAGDGHAVAGVATKPESTTAATWGSHAGAGAGVSGESINGYGGEFLGGRAPARLAPTDGVADGPPVEDDSTDDSNPRKVGELYVDGSGNLWFNTAEGLNFTRLNNQTVLFDDPQRAYDSRPAELPASGEKGPLTEGPARLVDLSAETDLPPDVGGVLVNLTVTNTVGEGALQLFNGDTADEDAPLASSINWIADNVSIANAITVRPNAAGEVNVKCVGTTDVVIDVLGYVI